MGDNEEQTDYEEEQVGDVPEDIEVSNVVISTESRSYDFENDSKQKPENDGES